jgi:pyruvate/2-oxoglutarate dehydrogenase complex dihydrolipoamide acyltransferase (E2) component
MVGLQMVLIGLATDDPDDGEFVLVRWLKPDGGMVYIDEPIAELETEKASIDIPAWATGILRHIAKEGDRLTIATVEHQFARIDPVEQ